MIAQLRGRLLEKNPTDVLVDCNGVGYEVQISLHTYDRIPDQESVTLHTYLLVREDSHTLYGFADKMEREIFKMLLSVSGIGASTARTMLSSLSPDHVAQAIANGDVATIQSIKGIGAKTAQRVLIDLRDKIVKVFDMDTVSGGGGNTAKEEALSALETLGFTRKAATKVIDKNLRTDPNSTTEMLIKEALKQL